LSRRNLKNYLLNTDVIWDKNLRMREYSISLTNKPPEMQGLWHGAVWRDVTAVDIVCFRAEGSTHRPMTLCKLLYDLERIYGIFKVEDQYVRCIHSKFQSAVYNDSCVEFFVQPPVGVCYFNFEFNCGGAMLASFVTDPTRITGRVKSFIPLTPDDDAQIQRYHSLPVIVDPEITQRIIWLLEFSIPFAVLEKYAGKLRNVSGQTWRGNFYKCGNETSHSHWGAWSPVNELNFHLPADFGIIQFVKP
jgi:Carbohydrate-binding family 9